MIREKGKWSKGEMSKTIVIYCIRTLTLVLIWSIAIKTAGAIFGFTVDLSDILPFAATAFGGELLLLAFKRIFAKKKEDDCE